MDVNRIHVAEGRAWCGSVFNMVAEIRLYKMRAISRFAKHL